MLLKLLKGGEGTKTLLAVEDHRDAVALFASDCLCEVRKNARTVTEDDIACRQPRPETRFHVAVEALLDARDVEAMVAAAKSILAEEGCG